MMKWIASAAFGMEGMTGRDLKRLGMENVRVMDIGGAMFEGSFEDAFRANLWLRTCDRIMLVMGQFKAVTFEELFQGVKAIEWEKFLPEDARFPIRAKCVKSTLMSPSDVQKISKRAMVERMKGAYGLDWFDETGVLFQIDISIRDDIVTVSMDSSGEPLSKRGYRTWNGEAPLRETLAAALVDLSPWRKGMRLYDPCCGTGTLLIETAIKAIGRPAGIRRSFACEKYDFMPQKEMKALRDKLTASYSEDVRFEIGGSDINPEALELCRRHIKQAGFENRISVKQQDLRALQLDGEPGVFLLNPPYGERISDQKGARELYREIGLLMKRHPGWKLAVITADPAFERSFGKRASKKRRLYNGRLECEFYIYD